MSTYTQRLLEAVQFSKARIFALLPHMTFASFDEGDVICSKGSSLQSWTCVISGFVAASIPLDKGRPLPIHLYGQNTWFGELSLVSKQPSHYEYTCLTQVEVIGIGKKYFDTAILDEPDFVRFLARMMAWRSQQQSEMLMVMRLGSSPLRVFMGLAQYAEAIGNHWDAAFEVEKPAVADIPIGQNQIAALCGVSRTLFSEYIQQLAHAGWLTLRYGGIELQSVETWRTFARKQRERRHTRSRPSLKELLLEMDSAQAERGPHRFPNLMRRPLVAMA